MLVILDGWGLAKSSSTNAISIAKTPNFDHLWSVFPHTKLAASGEAVGLPAGQMGNSEVGHLNIGSGRVVLQDLPKISKAIEDGEFFNNKALLKCLNYAKNNNKPLHLLGLLSSGGVHSHEKHLYALLEMAKNIGVSEVFVHVITDGRDVEPKSAIANICNLEKKMKQIGVGKIATICGRYYAMDRDHRWDRTRSAYRAIVEGRGELSTTPVKVIEDSYVLGITDEFIRPTIIDRNGLIDDNNAVIFFNFRSDRPRQLVRSLIDEKFSSFKRDKILSNLNLVTLTEYEKDLPVSGIAFPFRKLSNTLSDVISANALSQFHTAETEKYAHVTYFFEGGNEFKEKGEDRLLVPSPKVSTYDEKPEMSAYEVKDELINHIGHYDFIVVNFANPDMVGHTGKIIPTVAAIEAVDSVLGEVAEIAYQKNYDILITADHGNAEKMVELDGSPCTSHTTALVPFIAATKEKTYLVNLKEPKLANIAPTILALMKLPQPSEMTEKSLLKIIN